MIRFKVLPVDESDSKAVAKVIENGSLGMGKTVARLEEEFADYIGAKYAIALNSCTNSLFLAMYYVRHFQIFNTNVEIPSMMVPLVANEILHVGFTPFFTAETDWVGHSYLMGGIEVIDSAHEVRKRISSDFDAFTICYSFYPTKPICGADGGMICTNNRDEAEWYRKARYFGRDNGDSITKNSWEYGIEFPGWKMHMSDVQAAIVLNQLRKYPETDKKMDKIRITYNALLNLNNTSNYLYRVNVHYRDQFIEHMQEVGVECGVHFYPLHMMPIFKQYYHEDMTKVEEEYRTTVSLPFHTALSDSDIKYIVDQVLSWEELYGKRAS